MTVFNAAAVANRTDTLEIREAARDTKANPAMNPGWQSRW
jgi:hypothetical protein